VDRGKKEECLIFLHVLLSGNDKKGGRLNGLMGNANIGDGKAHGYWLDNKR
jgi:hypothetical protein